jgi:hypothetical protein
VLGFHAGVQASEVRNGIIPWGFTFSVFLLFVRKRRKRRPFVVQREMIRQGDTPNGRTEQLLVFLSPNMDAWDLYRLCIVKKISADL